MGAVEPYAGVKGRVSETGSRTADRRPGPKLGDVPLLPACRSS
jgi:hypothetical protein